MDQMRTLKPDYCSLLKVFNRIDKKIVKLKETNKNNLNLLYDY